MCKYSVPTNRVGNTPHAGVWPSHARLQLCGLGLWQDLQQIKDRENWYLPKFAADDAPDWNPGRFVRSRQLTLTLREVRKPASA